MQDALGVTLSLGAHVKRSVRALWLCKGCLVAEVSSGVLCAQVTFGEAEGNKRAAAAADVQRRHHPWIAAGCLCWPNNRRESKWARGSSARPATTSSAWCASTATSRTWSATSTAASPAWGAASTATSPASGPIAARAWSPSSSTSSASTTTSSIRATTSWASTAAGTR